MLRLERTPMPLQPVMEVTRPVRRRMRHLEACLQQAIWELVIMVHLQWAVAMVRLVELLRRLDMQHHRRHLLHQLLHPQLLSQHFVPRAPQQEVLPLAHLERPHLLRLVLLPLP